MDVERFRVRPGRRAALKHRAADSTGDFAGKEDAEDHLRKGIERLRMAQERLYARDQYALLLIFQGMDAAGKDSAITHVMSGVSPLGTDVHAFKQPSSSELNHTYLWRASNALPARGRVGLFNRSHYEEVLVVRVHPELLHAQRLPAERVTPRLWAERYEDINAFERHLWRNGTIVRKFFLHVSREEQRRRLLERLDDPAKRWKASLGDIHEREKWHAYMKVYEDALTATSSAHAPWYVIPADHKWFAHVAIAEIIVRTLDDLSLSWPSLDAAGRRDLAAARRLLQR